MRSRCPGQRKKAENVTAKSPIQVFWSPLVKRLENREASIGDDHIKLSERGACAFDKRGAEIRLGQIPEMRHHLASVRLCPLRDTLKRIFGSAGMEHHSPVRGAQAQRGCRSNS